MAGMGRHWHRLAGGGVILLFCILLVFRLGIMQKFVSGSEETAASIPTNVSLGETWMNITQDNRKIGYARRNQIRTENGFRFSENIFMRINTMGIAQPLTVRTTAELRSDRTLAGFQFDLGSNLFKFTARGAVSGKKLTVRIGGAGEEKISIPGWRHPGVVWGCGNPAG
jgi:hypothetical protein